MSTVTEDQPGPVQDVQRAHAVGVLHQTTHDALELRLGDATLLAHRGFAGTTRRAEVDTAVRHALALEAMASRRGGRGPLALGVPDGFSYEITVDGTTVHCAAPKLSEAQRSLVAKVLREGRGA